MDQKTLIVEERKELKKGASGRLRRMGKIPAIIYGHNKPVTISVDASEFEHKFHTVSETTIIKLEMGKKSWDVLVKDFQDDPYRGVIDHIDFYEIEKGRALKTRVAVHLEGSPVGVKEGGILEGLTHELDIECLPKDLPESITVDVSALEIGNSIHVSELTIPDGVKVLTSSDQVVALVAAKKEEILEPEVEEEEGLEGEEGEEGLEGEEGEAAEEDSSEGVEE